MVDLVPVVVRVVEVERRRVEGTTLARQCFRSHKSHLAQVRRTRFYVRKRSSISTGSKIENLVIFLLGYPSRGTMEILCRVGIQSCFEVNVEHRYVCRFFAGLHTYRHIYISYIPTMSCHPRPPCFDYCDDQPSTNFDATVAVLAFHQQSCFGIVNILVLPAWRCGGRGSSRITKD